MTYDAERPGRGRRTTISHATGAAEGPPASGGAALAGERPDRRRLILFGVAAAVVLGILFALLMRPDLDRERGEERQATAATERSAGDAPTFDVKAAREPYRAPDRDAISQAYAQAGQVFSGEGVSGLARYGLECFRTLERRTTYRQLDYCLAFDAFGAAINQRVSGGQPAPPESYFGQAPTRHLTVAEAAVGGEGDASARLTDIRRIAIEVARLSGQAATANASAPAAATGPALAAAPRATQVPAEIASAPVAEGPGVQASATAPAPPVDQRPPPVRAQAQAPASAEAPAQARVQAPAPTRGPTAQEVAAARPARGSGPSFNCRYARTASERMICSNPELSAADRRLNAAYEDAIAAGADRAALRLEQDRWLAQREGAAPDPAAVRDVYERRIEELSGRR